MRYALVLALVLSGCWDFEALHRGSGPLDLAQEQDLAERVDLSPPSDMLCEVNGASEDCSNGVDDNGDCLMDCADPQCKGTTICQPIRPLGYGRLVTTAAGMPAPACPAGSSQRGDVLYEGFAAPTTCAGCACDKDCAAELRSYAEADCKSGGAGAQETIALKTGTCAAVTKGNYAWLDGVTPRCNPNSSAARPDPVTYSRRDALCLQGGLNASCTTASCIKANLGLSGCLTLAEDVACPGPFSSRALLSSYVEGRTCTCSCTATGTALCAGAVTLYGAAMCPAAGPQAALVAKVCGALPAAMAPGSVSYQQAPTGLTCSPGATQIGSVTRSSVTLCCLP